MSINECVFISLAFHSENCVVISMETKYLNKTLKKGIQLLNNSKIFINFYNITCLFNRNNNGFT